MLKIRKTLIFFLTTVLFTFSCSNEIIDSELNKNQAEIVTAKDYSSSIETESFIAKRYVGNLEYVIGDVKQALITNKFTTRTKIDNALEGFKDMGVNGIRIPIYPDGYNPNQAMFDYFYTQAKAKGFKIFANPAQGGGGARIVNGSLSGSQIAPKNIPGATGILVRVVKEFASKYKCDWINPFNEDGRPGGLWYGGQMDNVYKGLVGQLNGAELIGPCVWGIPASIEVLKRTEIKKHITVAATHNLGWNHSFWPEFIREAGSLPVWDSETHNLIEGHDVTRLDAALNAGVDGLVLYNSWRWIDLNTGKLKAQGQVLKDKVTQYYYIQNKSTGKRIKPFSNSQENSLMVQVPGNWFGDFSKWELIPTSAGYFQFRNKVTKKYFRPNNNNNFSDIISVSTFSGSGSNTQWKIEDAKDGYLFIENRATGKKMRSRNNEDITTNNNANAIKINQAPTNWLGDKTQWKLIPAAN